MRSLFSEEFENRMRRVSFRGEKDPDFPVGSCDQRVTNIPEILKHPVAVVDVERRAEFVRQSFRIDPPIISRPSLISR